MAKVSAAIALCFVGCSGCGLALQTALGWSDEEVENATKQAQVHVATEPSGAQITRKSDRGEEQQLGPSPLTDTLRYDVEQRTISPDAFGLLAGGGVELAAGVGGILLGRGAEKCFPDDSCFETQAPKKGLLTAAGILLVLSAIDLTVAWVHGSDDDRVESAMVDAPAYGYVARKDGFVDAAGSLPALADAPNLPPLRLRLEPLVPVFAAKAEPKKEQLKNDVSRSWVVAVMELDDRTTRLAELAIDPDVVRNVAHQVRVLVSQRGYRTIDAGAQEQALREQIQAAKLVSYDACFDESCQVELGKALAASHIIRSSISRFGTRCVLNAELVDLTSEVIVAAASSTGDCLPEGFLGMSDHIARHILP